jgi:hypothetical protein
MVCANEFQSMKFSYVHRDSFVATWPRSRTTGHPTRVTKKHLDRVVDRVAAGLASSSSCVQCGSEGARDTASMAVLLRWLCMAVQGCRPASSPRSSSSAANRTCRRQRFFIRPLEPFRIRRSFSASLSMLLDLFPKPRKPETGTYIFFCFIRVI